MKYVIAAAGAVLAAYTALGDVLGPIIAANPKVAGVVGIVVAFLSWLATSPLVKKDV